ncbi:alpha-L-fucosidase [Pseudoduganella namucuonensis]|uniref:alpha-L-fucosidase n=2 Tax=Pseudoduganella namucuonensis TaxID=1035707 RepID=A0A1I7M6Y9_9BURK|nr:alpha-L-fucosidase [Pseudoduganella namucuonensis]
MLAVSMGSGLPAAAAAATPSAGPARRLARPSAQQLAFDDMELGVFIHYSIDTYGSVSAGMPASAFNPTSLDTEQWVLAAKAMGARYVVLTARHEQGFCLWPTATTGYSVRNSPYKNGEGDIVREFVDACRKHGVKPGLYTPPWIDDHFDQHTLGMAAGQGNAAIGKYDDPARYAKVRDKELRQQQELLTRYGPLVFYWDDHYGRSDSLSPEPQGGKLRELYAELGRQARRLQPDMLYFGPDVEHVGNESGHSCYPMWNAVDTVDGTRDSCATTYKWDGQNAGSPHGRLYRPRLGPNTDALSSGGWMWTGPRTVPSLQERMRVYYELIGRGAGAIVNLTPDASGRIPDNLVAAATEMGDEIRRRFSTPVARTRANGLSATLRFDAPRRIDHLVTMEGVAQGQKIARYRIEARVDGGWKTIVEGQTVGHKRIDRVEPVTVTALRFVCTEALERSVNIRGFAAYDTAA